MLPLVGSALVALLVGSFTSQTSVNAVDTRYYSPASNVPEGFNDWLLNIAYPATESTSPEDGQRFINTFAENGKQGTFIIGSNVFKGPEQIMYAWTNVPKAVKSLEHFPTDVSWDGGSKYAVFGLIKYAQLDGECSQKSYATHFIFDAPGQFDGHLTMYHDWLSSCGLPGDLKCDATWTG